MGSDTVLKNTGLRGVTVATTKICELDGNIGKLTYRGYWVKDLAGSASFEEVAYLLLFEDLPTEAELKAFKQQLADEMYLTPALISALKACPADALPMDILQAGVALLATQDPDIEDDSLAAVQRMAVRLIARMPVLIAAWQRIRNGQEPLAADPKLGHAANFLWMLTGQQPEPEVAGYFDAALVLHAEHTFNASTFSARQVASTRAHIYASISAAVGSLSGSLHGGANTRVMRMLQAIGSLDKVGDYVEDILNSGGKIMGLGHAVYKVDDPRAHILAPMSQTLGEKIGEPHWYQMSKELEVKGKAAFKERKGTDIFVNVDFYSASLYYAMGIPIDFFTPVFALSRVAGWSAHVLEEQFAGAAEKPALYRPSSEYTGTYCGPAECPFVPLDSRK